MMLLTNVLIGFLAWAVFYWIGLDNAGAWALAAGLLHVIPYLGPALTAGATGMAAFMQFDSISTALLAVILALVLGHAAPQLAAAARDYGWYARWLRWL